MARWILLRGLGREAEHWFDLKALLEEKSQEVMPLDLPGFGVRTDEKAPITIANTTDKVREQFLAQKADRKDWILLGISLGGMVAMDWAARYPMDFEGLVVINASSKDSGPLWQRLTVFGWYKIIQALTKRKNPREREKAILEMVSNLKKDDPAVLEKMVAIASERPQKVENLSRQLLAASNFMAPASIKIPTLMLASLKDNMVDVRCTKLLSERLGALAKYHPEAGHELPLDDPQWVLEQLMEFESQIDQGPGH